MASPAFSGAAAPASDLLRSSCNGATGGGAFPLRSLGRARPGAGLLWMGRRGEYGAGGGVVVAKIRKGKKHDYPWPGPEEIDPNAKGGNISYLSHFKPLKEKPKPVTLPFEKPLMDLQKKIIDVRKMANETGLDFSDQIISLENKYQQALKDLYTHLTPIQRLSIARHPNRPTFLDHVLRITDKWVELHGDRAGYDDPAIVTGIGSINGRSYIFMGHQKGRNTKENIERNFGMPTPHGYRKALRMMHYADHHGLPIITFIDTPGAFADLKSEELGQGEAIAHNLRTMFGLKVPIVAVVIGEGGSGGALAIGCANKLLMLENAVFYVASPEACAAILWKSSKAAPKAAEKLRITATELCKLKIADGIIPEPLGGAHADPSWTSQQLKIALVEAMDELLKMETPILLHHRMLKFRKIGGFIEGETVDPSKAVNMKKKEEAVVPEPQNVGDLNLEDELEKLKQQMLRAKTETPTEPPETGLKEMVVKLKKEVDQELAEAAKSLGFADRLETLRKEVIKARSSPEQTLDSRLKEKIEILKQEFNESLTQSPNFPSLGYKLDMLKDISKAKKVSSLKQEINKAFKMVMERPDIKQKVELLKSEISDAEVSKSSGVDDGLKEKILKVKREVESEFIDTLKSVKLNVDAVAPKVESSRARDLIEQPLYTDLREEMEDLDDQIEERIKVVIDSTDLSGKIEILKLEVAKAGPSPDPETESRIEAMKRQIKDSLAEAASSPQLVERFNSLKQDIARLKESSEADSLGKWLDEDGGGTQEMEEMNMGTNSR
ncbi:hypothetical protein Taro_020172 [Colocasia esculenta]|uniref:acetyl-CoA carboxytransferase n=1 Tax=Colocasia esculenta TaxID=4460 RepID=A0A843V1K2_COLES|nr:hypothetical protein [Colocasia esculenta]